MVMVTYDGLNVASAHSCKTDRLTVWKVPCHCGSDRRWYVYIHMRSSSGLFHVHINTKSVNQFPAGKRKFTRPRFGMECKRQCREDAAEKL